MRGVACGSAQTAPGTAAGARRRPRAAARRRATRVARPARRELRRASSRQPGRASTSAAVRKPSQSSASCSSSALRGIGPGFLAHARDRLGIEPAEVGRVSGSSQRRLMHGLRAALLERRVVEVGIRPRRRAPRAPAATARSGRARRTRDLAASIRAAARSRPSMSIASCRQSAIVCAPADGRGSRARRPGSRRRRPGPGRPPRAGPRRPCAAAAAAPSAAAEARQRQRDARHSSASARRTSARRAAPAPAPARTVSRMQVARDLVEREAVRRRQRQHDGVLGRRRLQLEVELAAEALAQRQPPGAVDAAAEGRMDDQLHAAGFVEEALEHDACPASAGSPARRAPRAR